MRVLITGIAGAHARLLTRHLVAAGHEVFGIDRRPFEDAPEGVKVYRADVRKRPAEDVFRNHRPNAVVHMATVTHFGVDREERYRINLQGTRAIFDHCVRFGVEQAVFVGRHTIYGAAPDVPLFRREDEPPLAMSTFPELADLVAADLYAGSALWRYPSLATAVLRLVYTLGPLRRGTLASFLAGKRVPMVLGFDPLFQFMHDDDFALAVALAVEHHLKGVFNVAGPRPIPLSALCRGTGRTPVRLPAAMLPLALGRFGLPALPPGAIRHLEHPITIDDRVFRQATGFEPRFDEHAVMDDFGPPPMGGS